LWLLPALALGQEVGAILKPEVAIDLAADRPGEDAFESRSWLRAWARGETGDDATWFLEVRGKHEVLVGADVEAVFEGDVGESGWEGPAGPFRIKVGNLVDRWGKLDLLSQVDVINPRDLTAGPLMPAERQRVPVPMGRVSFGNDVLHSHTTYLPFGGVDRVDQRGSDWSFIRTGMIEDFGADAAEWDGATAVLLADTVSAFSDSFENQDPYQRRYTNRGVSYKGFPAAYGYNGEIFQRFAIQGKGYDVALMTGNYRTRSAAANLDPGLRTLIQEERFPEFDEQEDLIDSAGDPVRNTWPRTSMVGLEASTVIDAFGVRAEGRWLSNEVLRRHWMKSWTAPSLGVGVGVDWAYGTTVLLSAEASFKQLYNPPTDLVFAAREHVRVGGSARVSAAGDRVVFLAGGAYDAHFGDWLARPTVTWRVSDNVELGAGAVLIEGPANAPKTLRQALQYEGGPGGYWKQNDAATLSVAWIL